MIGCLACLDATLGLMDFLSLPSLTRVSDPAPSVSETIPRDQRKVSSSTEARYRRLLAAMLLDGVEWSNGSLEGLEFLCSSSSILRSSARLHDWLRDRGEHPSEEEGADNG